MIRRVRRESDLVREVMALLDACNLAPMRVNVVSVRGRKADNAGMADIYFTLAPSGRAVWIECKMAGAEHRESQQRFQRTVESRGGSYILAYDTDDVRAFLYKERLIR